MDAFIGQTAGASLSCSFDIFPCHVLGLAKTSCVQGAVKSPSVAAAVAAVRFVLCRGFFRRALSVEM